MGLVFQFLHRDVTFNISFGTFVAPRVAANVIPHHLAILPQRNAVVCGLVYSALFTILRKVAHPGIARVQDLHFEYFAIDYFR